MIGTHGMQKYVGSGWMVLLATALSACAVAHAQTPPSSGTTAASDAGTAAASDAGTAAPTTASPAPSSPAPTYSGPPPYYFVRPPRTTAGLTPDSVARVLNRPANQQAIVQCYTNVLATDPRAHGVVSFRVEVIAGGFGSVGSVRIAPVNDSLRDCIRTAIGRFEWPNPSGSVPSTQVDAQIDLAPTPPATPVRRH